MRSTNKSGKHSERLFQNPLREFIAWFKPKPSSELNGMPYIKEEAGRLALHLDKLSVQSEMRLDAPDELVLEYTRALMSFMLFVPNPGHIAMIGLGGGSLAKYCYRYLPQSDILVIEINSGVIALRNEFAIPAENERFHVMLADGADYVSDAASPVDVLIVDGFDTGGQAPQLGTQQFYDNCFAKLNDNGLLAVNLWFGYPNYEKYVSRISNSFAGHIVIVDLDGDKANKIILAVKSTVFPPAVTTLTQRAESLCETQPINYQAMANKIIQALAAFRT